MINFDIDFAKSLMSESNSVTVSLLVKRNDNLFSKDHEVNSRRINICDERDISEYTFSEYTFRIDTERHLNESKIHLNKPGTMEFAKNVRFY